MDRLEALRHAAELKHRKIAAVLQRRYLAELREVPEPETERRLQFTHPKRQRRKEHNA